MDIAGFPESDTRGTNGTGRALLCRGVLAGLGQQWNLHQALTRALGIAMIQPERTGPGAPWLILLERSQNRPCP